MKNNILILILLFLIRCSSLMDGVVVDGIKTNNPKVKIIARDDSFEISSSKLTNIAKIVPNIGKSVDPIHPSEHDLFRIVNDFNVIYGIEVFIHIEGKSKPYYGILDINPITKDAIGAIAKQKSFEIKIPDILMNSEINLEGRAVVVYESYYRKGQDNSIYIARNNLGGGKHGIYSSKFKAWTLWISDKPIYVKKFREKNG